MKDIASDSIVRGTYTYEKEKLLTGARPADSSSAFAPWQGPGTVFYKVLGNALSPRHFKNSTDVGTIAVRYVVIPHGTVRTQVNIDAVFVEDGRRKAHASDGSVERAEFYGIQELVDKYHTDQQEAAEAQKQNQAEMARLRLAREHPDGTAKTLLPPEREKQSAPPASPSDSLQNLKVRLHTLQRELELQVKSGGAELKSAPFHAAASLKSIPAGTQVVILILTPQWYGVEATDGQRGWLRRDTVEPLP
ncbi:MAG: SH3 domain-containing protein [Acidobacteriaceae bacterium]